MHWTNHGKSPRDLKKTMQVEPQPFSTPPQLAAKSRRFHNVGQTSQVLVGTLRKRPPNTGGVFLRPQTPVKHLVFTPQPETSVGSHQSGPCGVHTNPVAPASMETKRSIKVAHSQKAQLFTQGKPCQLRPPDGK